ncbi:hypothetical protein ACFL34_03160 [Candidatus Sumerlaeota bacterium]
METWLAWAKGPAFWFAFTFMVLGLARHVGLTVWAVGRALWRAGDKSLPCRQIAAATLKWLLPFGKVRARTLYSATTLAFHVAIIVVPVLLAAHIELWRRGVGLGWPAIPNRLADALTLVAIVTALALVVERLAARDSRRLSRFQDYAIPLVIALPFISGFLAMHPTLNPFSYQATMFIHVMSGNLVFILIPLTKLSHAVLLPTTQLVSEVAWHFPPDAGSKVALALGKENESI